MNAIEKLPVTFEVSPDCLYAGCPRREDKASLDKVLKQRDGDEKRLKDAPGYQYGYNGKGKPTVRVAVYDAPKMNPASVKDSLESVQWAEAKISVVKVKPQDILEGVLDGTHTSRITVCPSFLPSGRAGSREPG